MTDLIVGQRAGAEALAQTAENGQDTRIWASDEPAGSSSAPLARALVDVEVDVLAGKPERIVLADDSDAALAAALVAAKQLIPLVAVEAAMRPSTANGRLIAQLANAYTRAA